MRDSPLNPRTPWLAIVLAAAAPTVAALLYIHATGSTTVTQIVYFASKALIFAFPLAWWLLAEHSRSTHPVKRSMLSRDLPIGAATGLLIGVSLWTVYLLGFRNLIDAETLTSRIEEFGVRDNYVLYALFLSIVNSGLEEYYWRWFLFGRLKPRVGMPAAVVLSSIAFAAHHFVALQSFLGSAALAGLFSVGIAVGGAVWAYHYHRTGRLWGVWLSHCIVDLAALSIGYHLLFHSS